MLHRYLDFLAAGDGADPLDLVQITALQRSAARKPRQSARAIAACGNDELERSQRRSLAIDPELARWINDQLARGAG